MPAQNFSSKRLTYECLRMIMITRLEIAASAAAAAVAWYDYYLLNESELLMTSLTIFVSASSIPAVSSTASSKVGAFKSHHLKLICIFLCIFFTFIYLSDGWLQALSIYRAIRFKLAFSFSFFPHRDMSWATIIFSDMPKFILQILTKKMFKSHKKQRLNNNQKSDLR